MTWKISHSPEAWDNARHNLAHKSKMWLAQAIAESRYQMNHDGNSSILSSSRYHRINTGYTRLLSLPKDILVDVAIECIESHNTCDNGGYNFYIDSQGWYEISVDSCNKESCNE